MIGDRILTIALTIIQYAIDPFIIVLGIYTMVRMLLRYQAMKRLHRRVEDELGAYAPSDVKVADKTLSADYHLKINLLKERQLKEEFDRESAQYIVLAQLIGIFPLLGILGTVAGLMLNVSAQDAQQMMSSLNTALSSTLWGLFFAIVLKTLDSYKLAPIVYLIESRFTDYETLYHNIQMEQTSREVAMAGSQRGGRSSRHQGGKTALNDGKQTGRASADTSPERSERTPPADGMHQDDKKSKHSGQEYTGDSRQGQGTRKRGRGKNSSGNTYGGVKAPDHNTENEQAGEKL